MEHRKYRLVLRNALLIPIDSSQESSFTANIHVSHSGHIVYIGPEVAHDGDADAVVDATGNWVLPGFISAHSHLWQSAFPGRACDESVNRWADDIYKHAAGLGADDFYELVRRGAQSHLEKGITTVFNFTYSPNFKDGKSDRAQFSGSIDAGIRFIHAFNIGAINKTWSVDQAVARTQKFLDWTAPYEETSQYLGTAVANHGVTYDDNKSIQAEAEIMGRFNLQGHLHYLESPLPDDIRFERSRWQWLKDAGLLNPRLILGHFVHPTAEMVSEAAMAGVRMSWNPLSNGRLGSGIVDTPAYLQKNLSIGLGVDGEASSDRCDPFENMRAGLYSVRGMYRNPKVLAPYDVLYMHTLGAARALGVENRVGSLTVGKFADMVLIEPPRSIRPGDPVSTVVLSAGIENVKEVFVGGVPISSKCCVPGRTSSEWSAWKF
ncbi:hypothetical protein ASPVEDRAFT_85711 [Aspergillus versicolor CBS 583.65]|uniref:Amidohydrolase-related domain-containing protein n=1 Tax=Aspergillus versicolor CBS 583.65 TaxID=1036611 RepID=A0A1L9PS10_ASPVE|nr:uncharacterized protein ASPVEDRAFT_85711 [Aspergillus versicolor CBS 583.65]OJJ04308.1 hypothetical protein ASPVEDRAFT_85711 [Aspergillus versicolor CBS 583.65]